MNGAKNNSIAYISAPAVGIIVAIVVCFVCDLTARPHTHTCVCMFTSTHTLAHLSYLSACVYFILLFSLLRSTSWLTTFKYRPRPSLNAPPPRWVGLTLAAHRPALEPTACHACHNAHIPEQSESESTLIMHNIRRLQFIFIHSHVNRNLFTVVLAGIQFLCLFWFTFRTDIGFSFVAF